VTLARRGLGRTKFGIWRIPGGVLDLLAVKFQYHTMRRPLSYFGMIALVLFLLAVVFGIPALYYRFVRGQGYRPLVYLVMTLGISAVMFFVLGVLAESVAGIRQQMDMLRHVRRYREYRPMPLGRSLPPPSDSTVREPRADAAGERHLPRRGGRGRFREESGRTPRDGEARRTPPPGPPRRGDRIGTAALPVATPTAERDSGRPAMTPAVAPAPEADQVQPEPALIRPRPLARDDDRMPELPFAGREESSAPDSPAPESTPAGPESSANAPAPREESPEPATPRPMYGRRKRR
jgi:hypothetical protein